MPQPAAKKPAHLIEFIVSRPPLATLVVGSSILLLNWLIRSTAETYASLGYLLFLVPFIPPFFITRTAKRINSYRAELDFIADAEPVIYVGYPLHPDLDSLMNTLPLAVSNSAGRYLGIERSHLLQHPILPELRFSPQERRKVFEKLLQTEPEEEGRRVIRHYRIQSLPSDDEPAKVYLLNTVLKQTSGEWKLQLTLFPE